MLGFVPVDKKRIRKKSELGLGKQGKYTQRSSGETRLQGCDGQPRVGQDWERTGKEPILCR